MGAVMMVVSWLIVVASLGWLLSATVRSIRSDEPLVAARFGSSG